MKARGQNRSVEVPPVDDPPSLKKRATSFNSRATRKGYPWIFVFPLIFTVICVAVSCFVFVSNPIIEGEMRLMFTLQGLLILQCSVPILFMSWFVSSLLEAAFNDRLGFSPSSICFYILAQFLVAFITVCLWQAGPVQLQLSGGGSSPPSWYFSFVLVTIAPLVIFIGIGRFSRTIYEREQLKKGMMAYVMDSLPNLGIVFLVVCALSVLQAAHAVAFSYLPLWFKCDKILAGACAEYLGEGNTYLQDNCNTSTIGVGYHGGHRPGANAERAENSRKLPGGQLIFGVQSWHCVDSPDSPWAEEIAPFSSLLDACQGAIQCKEMNQLQPLNVASAAGVFCIFLFRELITTIDDKMTRWNFISRSMNWARNNKSSRSKLSGPRIITAITLFCIGQAIFFLATIGIIQMCNIRAGIGVGGLGDMAFYGIIFGALLVLSSLSLLIFQLRHRSLYAQEITPEEVAAREAVADMVKEEKAGDLCSFWFVSAKHIRESKTTTLPRFQELRTQPGQPLQRIRVTKADAFGQQTLTSKFLAVSHRWLDPVEPDVGGEQMFVLKQHLNKPENASIEWVWYDYWCMPQHSTSLDADGKAIDDRSLADKDEFKWMLQNVDMLYLGASVLCMIDLSYVSRFWTQFEAWLSFQQCTEDGLLPAPAGKSRSTTVPTLNGTDAMTAHVEKMWAGRTPQQAHDLLRLPDVTVTNTKDKTTVLRKLLQMSFIVQEFKRQQRGKHEYQLFSAQC